MRNKFLLILLGFTGLVIPKMTVYAQMEVQLQKIEKCIRDYQDYSSLGNPGSTFIDSATIASFKELFESNASLYWDLYKSNSPKTNFLIPVDEYVDSVDVIYNGIKPIISYGNFDVKLNADGMTAIVYLNKNHLLQNSKLPNRQKFSKIGVTLRILLNIYDKFALIQNITRDVRLTRIRSLSFAWGYPFLTGISSSFSGKPVSGVDPSLATDFSMGNFSGYSFGLTTDIRVNRQTPDGIVINTGIIYTRTNFDVTVNNYEYAYRKTFDPGEYAYECTVFDRTPAVSESNTFHSISIPIILKWYLFKPSSVMQHSRDQNVSSSEKRRTKQYIRLKYYLKAGPQISLLSCATKATYELSHTGGGWFVYEREKNLPDPEKTWFYLDKNNERFDGPDFFLQKMFSFDGSVNLCSVYLSAVVALGIEAKFNKIIVGFEPWLNVGLTSVTAGQKSRDYPLYPADEYHSFVHTINSPHINSFGLNIFIGKVFNRK